MKFNDKEINEEDSNVILHELAFPKELKDEEISRMKLILERALAEPNIIIEKSN